MATVESEFKFDGGTDTPLPDLRDLPGLGQVDEGSVRLEANYWDTVDRRLASWGVTLRHRQGSDGSEDGWTLKLPVLGSEGAGLSRTEVNVGGGPEAPPGELHDLVRAMTLDASLVPVATLVTQRRWQRLGAERSSADVEVADDHVESRVNGMAGPCFRQIEVEIIGTMGDKAIRRITKALRSAGFRPSVEQSKLARVLGDPPATFPRSTRLQERATVRQFTSMVFISGVDQLVANDPGVRLGDDPEAVHQARVATRRLRADLKSFRPLLDVERVATLRGELKWLGELLGGVRDEDVMERNLDALSAVVGSGSGAGREIVEQIRSRREFRRGLLLSALNGERYLRLVGELMKAAEDPPLRTGGDPEARARPLVRRQAERSFKRVPRFVAHLEPEPGDAALHELRKAIKQARYGAQAARRVGLDTKEFARGLGRLQDELGDLHDAVVEKERLVRDVQNLTADGAFLAGQLHQAAEHRRLALRESWRERWEELTALRSPF